MGSRVMFGMDDAIHYFGVGLLGCPKILMPSGITIVKDPLTMRVEGHWRIPILIVRDQSAFEYVKDIMGFDGFHVYLIQNPA